MKELWKRLLKWHNSTWHLNWAKHLVIGTITYFIFLLTFIERIPNLLKALGVESVTFWEWYNSLPSFIIAYFLNVFIVAVGWEAFWFIYKNKAMDGRDIFWSQAFGMAFTVLAYIIGWE